MTLIYYLQGRREFLSHLNKERRATFIGPGGWQAVLIRQLYTFTQQSSSMSLPQGLCVYGTFWIAVLLDIRKAHSLTSFKPGLKGHLDEALPDDPIWKSTAAPHSYSTHPALSSSYHSPLSTWQLSKIMHIYLLNRYACIYFYFLPDYSI